MTESEKVRALATDLSRVLTRYRSEFAMTLASVVGTLEVLKLDLFKEETEDDS